MDSEGEQRALTILNLLFKRLVEEGVWGRFCCNITHQAQLVHAIDLPNIYQMGIERAAESLVRSLGSIVSVSLSDEVADLLFDELESEELNNAESCSDSEDEFQVTSDETEDEDECCCNTTTNPEETNSEEDIEELKSEEECNSEDTITEISSEHILHMCELKNHLRRQSMLLSGALKDIDKDLTLQLCDIQYQLERFIFNPPPSTPSDFKEVRHNFYPPFLHPKAICNYSIFTITTSIPKSCKCNRYETTIFKSSFDRKYFEMLPRFRSDAKFNDDLGSAVNPVGELKEEVKLTPLVSDTSRLQFAKARGEHLHFFGYPSLHLPPKMVQCLMETLIAPLAEEGKDTVMSISDEEISNLIDPKGKMSKNNLLKAIQRRRDDVAFSIRYGVQLYLMERVIRNPEMIRKIQETLHHTFHHGYVNLVREVSKVNLSNYVTFHGITYLNPLNNCILANLYEDQDKADYIVDSIYLFLVLAWQTAMGMWHQAINDQTLKAYSSVLNSQKLSIYSKSTVYDISQLIIDLLMDGNRLVEEMKNALPNFTSSSQISTFRQFLMERSNIPSLAAPFMPSDFIPLCFSECHPILWDQSYLLQTAFFICNHGGYLHENEVSNFKYCPCNLCSPHRMPQDNIALHNEINAIGTFEFQTDDGKLFKLSPELWTNAYLDKFVEKDFHAYNVVPYRSNKSVFSKNLTPCVISSPEILSLIRQIQASREEFLLSKGKGVYKDPKTGETISHLAPQVHQAGSAQTKTIPATDSYIIRRNSTEISTSGIVQNSTYNGSENDRREENKSKRFRRRRINRKPGQLSQHGQCRVSTITGIAEENVSNYEN
ncbi:hexon assembly protein 100K [Crane-associated adenovirus 1]|uniref:Hexon assembly protein 100K n=1 Tax=Crane-associated adenovirus 1 TaxID=2559941 RepID=A0A5H2X6P8_9ADEN|nr:hexon assembly protein 100K [Crane-associated adenovirus 1]